MLPNPGWGLLPMENLGLSTKTKQDTEKEGELFKWHPANYSLCFFCDSFLSFPKGLESKKEVH